MKKFSIPLTEDANHVLARFKAVAMKNGLRLSGNHQLGKFSGRGIEGGYAFDEDLLTVTISKKPIFIGWSLIEAKMREFFAHPSGGH